MENRCNIAAFLDRIDELVPGFSPKEDLYSLFLMSSSLSTLDGNIVEIGSWCGRSTCALGAGILFNEGRGKVYSVDLFPRKDDWLKNADGAYSFATEIAGHVYYAYRDQEVWSEPFLKQVLPAYGDCDESQSVFNNNIAEFGLSDVVDATKGDVGVFLEKIKEMKDFSVKLVFIDGDHSEESVSRDIELLDPFIREGGWLVLDDASGLYDGVERAVNLLLKSPRYSRAIQLTRKLCAFRKL